ncbi:Heat shock 70 kDa protein 14 (Heat shock protein 70-14) (AtHsp70-14) (Heat shock protein 91), partial [Durusdinium trenchii]
MPPWRRSAPMPRAPAETSNICSGENWSLLICLQLDQIAPRVQSTVCPSTNYRKAAEQPTEKYSHIAKEKLEKILNACKELELWLTDAQKKQEAMPKYQKPVVTCSEMDKRNQELAKMADEILKEPKPKEEPK